MSRKKTVTLLFTLVLCLVLTGQVSSQTNFGPKTEPFFKIFASGTYRMKTAMTASGSTGDMEQFAKGGKIASVTTTQGQTVRTVISSNKTHMIMESAKMMMITASQSMYGTGAVDANSMKFTGSGTAVFTGKNLPYEEYINSDGSKTQFFIDGNRLAGTRSTVPGQGTADMVILVLDQNVPDSIFNIPTSGYQVQDISNMRF